ncbi:MAG: hypothetical protein ED557_07060 [Balneola sp.]|nr:MAG: hypothetical protein ED557_07060 [Balneola sp.]
MKTSFLMICFLVPTIGLSQESVGFQNKADFQKLIYYRLPEWGYKNFYLSTGHLRYDWRNTNTTNEIPDPFSSGSDSEFANSVSNFNINLTPHLTLFRESEQRVYQLNTSFSVFTQVTNTEDKQDFFFGEDHEKIKLRNLGIQPSVYFDLKEYIGENFFISTSLNTDFRIIRSKRDEQQDSFEEKDVTINRRINAYPSFGIGFGRVRNISPILRSLRLNERYKDLGNNSFSSDEIIEVAELFTKYNGYLQRYDRPLKYFWQDINEASNNKLDQLNAYELFFLNDVFNENLGQRFEGAEIELAGFYRYENLLRRTEDENRVLQLRDIIVDREAGFRVNARAYKNLSLEHQISAVITTFISLPLERTDPVNWNFNGTSSIGWLWNIADQMIINTFNNTYYQTSDIKDDPELEETYFANTTQSSLSFFIENRVSISAGISFNYNRRFVITRSPDLLESTTQNHFFGFNVSVRYYFDRNLY